MEGLTFDRHKIVPILDWNDLTQDEQSDFSWAKDSEFFHYLGQLYCVDDFLIWNSSPEWDGILSETFFSGVFIKFEEKYVDQVHCVRYFS